MKMSANFALQLVVIEVTIFHIALAVSRVLQK